MKRYFTALVVTQVALLSFVIPFSLLSKEKEVSSVTQESSVFSSRVLIPAATNTPPIHESVKIAYKSEPFPVEITKPAARKVFSSYPKVTFDSVYRILAKIARCESGGDPLAKNKTSSAKGLLQIIDGTWEHFSCEGSVLDADDNMQCGVKIAMTSGLHHWDESRSCWIGLVGSETLADNR
ncbi:transglycosylase family protein [Patescibacteria group bacterium]|nr:transglycosylase family protein [Patescibacteria group bacterium]